MNDAEANRIARSIFRNKFHVKGHAGHQTNAAWAYVERLYRELLTGGIAEKSS